MWLLLASWLIAIYGHRLLQPFIYEWDIKEIFLLLYLFFDTVYRPLAEAHYASQSVFLALWSVGLSVCMFLWVVSQRGWSARVTSFLPLGLLAIAPIVVPGMYGTDNALDTYKTPPGYEVIWLTKPKSDLASAIRKAQSGLQVEFDVIGVCEPKLLGWSQDNQLYYFTSDWRTDTPAWGPRCWRNQGDLWVYDPVKGDEPQRIQRLSYGLASASGQVGNPGRQEEEERRATVPNFVSAADWPGHLAEEAISPNGNMRAAVILDLSSIVYEVIVMRRADP